MPVNSNDINFEALDAMAENPPAQEEPAQDLDIQTQVELYTCDLCGREGEQETEEHHSNNMCQECVRIHTCEGCRNVQLSTDDLNYIYDEGEYCNDCSRYCDSHEEYTNREVYETTEGEYACQNCVDEYYYQCDQCHNYAHENYVIRFIDDPRMSYDDAKYSCENCASENSLIYNPLLELYTPRSDDMIEVVTGLNIGQLENFTRNTRLRAIRYANQLPREAFVLTEINSEYLREAGVQLSSQCNAGHMASLRNYERGRDQNCSHCTQAIEIANRAIAERSRVRQPEYTNIHSYHSHSYSDRDFHHMAGDIKSGNTMYFGIELETTFSNTHISNQSGEQRAQKILAELKGTFVGERDGTVSNGAELISKPMTYSYLTSKTMMKRLDKAITKMQELGALNGTHHGIGLHVHVSKMPFRSEKKATVEMEDDMNWFINCFKQYVEVLARRKETNYCKFPITKVQKPVNASRMYIDKRVLQKGSHGYALNLTQSRTPTYEFRMFNSTQNLQHLIASVEFVRNLSLYAINEPTIIGATFKDVVEYKPTLYLSQYVKSLAKEYPAEMKGWRTKKLKAELEIK